MGATIMGLVGLAILAQIYFDWWKTENLAGNFDPRFANERRSLPVSYRDPIKIKGPGGVEYELILTTADNGRVNYSWTTSEGEARQGRGHLFENYEWDENDDETNIPVLTDKGSQIRITIDDLQIEWSSRGDHSGWIYFQPSDLSVEQRPDNYNKDREPSKSFHAARNLLKAGDFAAAHQKHLWMFENIDDCHPPSFFLTVYNLTYDWHQVALQYPPAMDALIARRDERTEWLLSEGKDIGREWQVVTVDGLYRTLGVDGFLDQKICFYEVVSTNKWLDEDAKTVALYEKLEGKLPIFADSMSGWVRDVIEREDARHRGADSN